MPRNGAPPSYHALLAMDELGVDISGHMARRFRPEMGEGALLLAMTRSHARALRSLCPNAKVELFLGDEEVPIPSGGAWRPTSARRAYWKRARRPSPAGSQGA